MKKYIYDEKQHYRMYKKGKQWLFAAITVVSVGTFASIQSVHADQVETNESAKVAASQVDNSPNEAAKTDASTASTPKETANSAATETVPSTDSKTTESADAIKTAPASIENKTPDTNLNTKIPDFEAPKPAPVVSDAKNNSEQTNLEPKNQENTANTPNTNETVKKEDAPAVAKPTASVKAPVKMMAAKAAVADATSAPTAPTLTKNPVFSNFNVSSPNSRKIFYNSPFQLNLSVYRRDSGTTVADEMYGLYVVLPKGMTADLSKLQVAANNFVTGMSTNNQTSNFTSMTVYNLGATSDGRAVYYYRPNDGATSTPAAYTNLLVPVTTAASNYSGTANNPVVNFNAGTADKIPTDGVLFGGIGNYTQSGAYSSITTASLGITNALDQNMVSISAGNAYNRPTSYVDLKETDTYKVVDSKGNTIKTIQTVGDVGSTYSRVNLVDTLKSLGLTPDTSNPNDPNWRYNANSLSISSGQLNDPAIKYLPLTGLNSDGSIPDSRITGGNLNADGSIVGNTYTVTVPTYNAAGKVTVQYVYQKKDASGNISYIPMANLPSTFPTEATYTSGQFIGNNQQYQISLPADPDGYKFAKTNNGGLTGALTSTAQTIQVVYDQLASQVTANYYAVDKGNPYYVYNGTYTTDKDLALSNGGSLYLLGSSDPYKGFTGDSVTINAPAQNPLEGPGQQKIDYYNFYGASGLDGKLQKGVSQLNVTYPADGGTVSFYYVKKFPAKVTYHDVGGNDLHPDYSQTYTDGDAVTYPMPLDIAGSTIDFGQSTITLIESAGDSESMSIKELISQMTGNTNPTNEDIISGLSALDNGFFPVVKFGNQMSGTTVSYVYKTNA